MAALAAGEDIMADSGTGQLQVLGGSDGTWKATRDRSRSQSRLGGFFATAFNKSDGSEKENRLEELQEVLNGYSSTGLPDYPDLLSFQKRPQEDASMYDLKTHWDVLVDDAILQKMSKRERDHQEAIWELLHTEEQYMKKLQVILDVFKCVLLNLQSNENPLLNDIDADQLFNNIHDVYTVNASFWKTYFLPVVQDATMSRKGLRCHRLKQGFVKFAALFAPYTKYCLDQVSNIHYMKTTYKENEMFKLYVQWCESQKQCNRLKLNDLLVKPMQRLTKYALLLNAVLKKTDNNQDRSDLKQMIKSVESFVTSVNDTLRRRHEQEQLASIMDKIECYDVVDGPNSEVDKIVSQYATLDLTNPMPGCGGESRSLIQETNMRIRDAVSSRMEVRLFLFTDMLLVCKATTKRGDKFRVVKQPFRVDRIVIHELKDAADLAMIYVSEYGVATAAYTLHCSSPTQARSWIDHIKKAQDMFASAKMAATSEKKDHSLNYLEITDEDAELELPMSAILSQQFSSVHSRINSVDSSSDDVVGKRDASGAAVPCLEPSDSADVTERWPLLVQADSFSSNDSDPPNAVNDGGGVGGGGDDDERCARAATQRRLSRSDKRYHTADSIEQLRADRLQHANAAIVKRMSWNSLTAGNVDEDDASVVAPTAVKCLSSDSMRSSSGVSSNGSIHLSYPGDGEGRGGMRGGGGAGGGGTGGGAGGVSVSRQSSSACSDVSERGSANEHDDADVNTPATTTTTTTTTTGKADVATVYMSSATATSPRMVRSASDTREEKPLARDHSIRRQAHSVTELCSSADGGGGADKPTTEYRIERMAEVPETESTEGSSSSGGGGGGGGGGGKHDVFDIMQPEGAVVVSSVKPLPHNERLRIRNLLLNSASIEASDV